MSARPGHFEIHAGDPEAVMRFYGDALGWTFQRMGEDDYWLASTGQGEGIDGALMRRQGQAPADGAPVMGATLVMTVDDVDAMSQKVLGAGGTLTVPKITIPGQGWCAYFKDPDGNVFGLFQSDEGAR